MSAKPIARICDCKGNTFFAYKQIEKYFLLEILIYTCIYSKKLVTLCPKMCINSKNNIL